MDTDAGWNFVGLEAGETYFLLVEQSEAQLAKDVEWLTQRRRDKETKSPHLKTGRATRPPSPWGGEEMRVQY